MREFPSGSVPKKSCIRETKNLSTAADSRTDKILEMLRDLSQKKNRGYMIFFLKTT